jgi:hypothetical protein
VQEGDVEEHAVEGAERVRCVEGVYELLSQKAQVLRLTRAQRRSYCVMDWKSFRRPGFSERRVRLFIMQNTPRAPNNPKLSEAG